MEQEVAKKEGWEMFSPHIPLEIRRNHSNMNSFSKRNDDSDRKLSPRNNEENNYDGGHSPNT